jgi:hypothetical protein
VKFAPSATRRGDGAAGDDRGGRVARRPFAWWLFVFVLGFAFGGAVGLAVGWGR